eukprot:1461559-Pleurochrysis_carterae.AAC.2
MRGPHVRQSAAEGRERAWSLFCWTLRKRLACSLHELPSAEIECCCALRVCAYTDYNALAQPQGGPRFCCGGARGNRNRSNTNVLSVESP